MKKKDFELIARVLKLHAINSQGIDTEQRLIISLCDSFADELEHTHERFDRERFLNACGM